MESLLSQNLLSLPHALLASSLQGFGGAIVLFVLCFLGVHIAKIAIRGWRLYDGTTETKPPENPEKTEPKAEQKPAVPEPIYYIVEKKRRRSKASYGDPKEIRFK